MDRPPRIFSIPVHVVHGSGAGLDHFEGGHPCAIEYEPAVEPGLDLPDVVKPVAEHHVFSDAPHQGHRGMGVHVHEPGKGYLSGTVDNLASFPGHVP